MRRMVLWIVGEPGIGKTTIARMLLESHWRRDLEIISPKWTGFGPDMCAAGWWRGEKFDGADTLPISQIKLALPYWRDHMSHRVAVIDGDKLSNSGAVQVANEMGARMACVLLTGVSEAIDRRLVRGTAQNEKWIDGRRTKARNFHHRFPRARYTFGATLGTDKLLTLLQEIIR